MKRERLELDDLVIDLGGVEFIDEQVDGTAFDVDFDFVAVFDKGERSAFGRLGRCLTDDEHRSQLGAAGREVVRRRYTLEGIGDRFDEALRETIGDDAKGGQG